MMRYRSIWVRRGYFDGHEELEAHHATDVGYTVLVDALSDDSLAGVFHVVLVLVELLGGERRHSPGSSGSHTVRIIHGI